MNKEECEIETSKAIMEMRNHIEELEKENAELEERIRNQAESLGVTLLEEDKKAKQIKELEKENAELKETNESLLESCAGTTMMYEDLCKAKEIIKNLMVFAEIDSREYEKEYKEAEQFLKEVKE